MPFLHDDLYLASSTGQVINNWVDPVYKFDSSSFYNWEQDNLPVYDLEDRDDLLHEMAGSPATAPSGIMLVVSDCGIDNKKIFGTLSGALEALPNTIRSPVIIEVCTSGQLGTLRLENKEISPSGGGLEIINRGFAKFLAGSGTPSSMVSSTELGAADGSSVIMVSSFDASQTMSNTFSVGLSGVGMGSKNVADQFLFWSVFNRAFLTPPEWSNDSAISTRTVTMSSKFNDIGGYTGGGFVTNSHRGFMVAPYSDNSVSSDIVITNTANDSHLQRANIDYIDVNSTRAVGFSYVNALSNVTVKNCTGKIYIRGFCVDGASQADITAAGSQRTQIGFDIQDSEVVIENCTATRCKDAGMQAVNSTVTLNRGFIACHNYELQNLTNGASVLFLNNKVSTNQTPGLRAVNSTLTLSSALTSDKGCPVDSPFCFSRNMVGIELENSQILTPRKYRYGLNPAGQTAVEVAGSLTLVLQTFFNMNEGIKAKQSLIEWGGRIASFQNKVGVRLENSTCKIAEGTLDHNQEGGLVADGSIFNYNKNAQLINRSGPFSPANYFQNNGQHVVLNNSQFVPTYVSGMDTVYRRLTFSGNHQVDNYTGNKTTLPGVVVTNGSYMNAVCPAAGSLASDVDSTVYRNGTSVKGAAFQVTKNSTLDLNGTGERSTVIVGPYLWSKQQKAAALYAGENSNINIAGPTTIVQYGIDALAEDNSTIQIGPHQKDGAIDVSGWSLYNDINHTQVQLHATRACLVANRNSTLNMHDLGDYHAFWDPKYVTTSKDYLTGNNEYYTSSFCSSGSIQFYPNPFIPYGTAANQVNAATQAAWPVETGGIDITNTSLVELPTQEIPSNNVSSTSYGGMCVRAVGESIVHANNLRFPVGWKNPSGPYYDGRSIEYGIAGYNLCDHLRIWNIADNSELYASYLSVEESHPQDMSGSYYGPSAMWVSSLTTFAPSLGLSGAPSSTPDTSSASILDSFGIGVQTVGELGYYGKTAQENIGPFRIYVSPHPKAKFLGYPFIAAKGNYIPPPNPAAFYSMGFEYPDDAILQIGLPYQLIAQGYATSSDCSAINNQGVIYTNASAIYQDLGFSGYITSLPADQQGQNVASSFYYTSAMLPHDSESRIWLDESAMNTFANAKNGTLNTSGRKKLFSYYKATTSYPGEGLAGALSNMKGTGIGSANLFDLERDL